MKTVVVVVVVVVVAAVAVAAVAVAVANTSCSKNYKSRSYAIFIPFACYVFSLRTKYILIIFFSHTFDLSRIGQSHSRVTVFRDVTPYSAIQVIKLGLSAGC
jgi:hypothetical protein